MIAQLEEQVEQVGRERVHPCHFGLSFPLEGLKNRLAQLLGGLLLSLVALHQLQVRLHRGCSQVITRIEVNEVLVSLQKLDVGKPRCFFKVGAEPLEQRFPGWNSRRTASVRGPSPHSWPADEEPVSRHLQVGFRSRTP